MMAATSLTIRAARAQLVAQALARDPGADLRTVSTFRGWSPTILAQAITDAADAKPGGGAA